MTAAQQTRPDVAAERMAFARWQPTVAAARLVFVDESGICQGMRLAYGYAPCGERCVERVPFRVGKRTSLLGWMCCDGGEIVSFKGSVTQVVFEQFVEESLVPALELGDIVLWDNAKIHSARAVEMIEAAGARVLAIPRYSPEFNPIELLWSKLKHYIKKARADTAEALWGALVEAAAWLTEADAVGWIEHCGYCLQPS